MGSHPLIIASSAGFDGETSVPDPIGGPTDYGHHQTPIARWVGCPYQAIGHEGLNVGISAYHINGISRIEYQANGGEIVTITEPTFDDRGVEAYWVTLVIDDSDLAASDGGQRELRATIYPDGPGTPVVYQGNNAMLSKDAATDFKVRQSECAFFYCSTKDQATYLLDPTTDTFENALSVLLEQPGDGTTEWVAGSTQAPIILVDTTNVDGAIFFADNRILGRPYTNGLLTIKPAFADQRVVFKGDGAQKIDPLTGENVDPLVSNQAIAGSIQFIDCDFEWNTRLQTGPIPTDGPPGSSQDISEIYHFKGCDIDGGADWFFDYEIDYGAHFGRPDAGITGLAWFHNKRGDASTPVPVYDDAGRELPDQDQYTFIQGDESIKKVVFEDTIYRDFGVFNPPQMCELVNSRVLNAFGDMMVGFAGMFKSEVSGQLIGRNELWPMKFINRAVNYDETLQTGTEIDHLKPTSRGYSGPYCSDPAWDDPQDCRGNGNTWYTGDTIRAYYPPMDSYRIFKAARNVPIGTPFLTETNQGIINGFEGGFWETGGTILTHTDVWQTRVDDSG